LEDLKAKLATPNGVMQPPFVATAIANAVFDLNPSPHQVIDTFGNKMMYLVMSSVPHSWLDALVKQRKPRF
jgi:hypothetical protein